MASIPKNNSAPSTPPAESSTVFSANRRNEPSQITHRFPRRGFIIGFHLTFDFMHIPGLLGMPRRIYTYEPGRGWDIWNLVATIGVFFQAAGVVVFVANLVWSYFRGRAAGSDPWDAWTLEWSTPSPPPAYNFAVIPTVKSRRPLWDLKHPADPDWKYE